MFKTNPYQLDRQMKHLISTRRRWVAAMIAQSVVLASAAHAASIIWGPASLISGDADVSLNGTLVGAVNLDGPSVSVNGVSFQALDIDTGPATIGNFTVNGFFFNQFNPGFASGSAVPPFSSLSSSYQSLLATGAAVGGTMDLTMSGLVAGQSYDFQAWVNDSRSHNPPGFTFTVQVLADNAVLLDPNPSLLDGGLGQFVIGTFVADGATQNIQFDNGEVAVINGFQLRRLSTPIPEVGTLVAGLFMAVAAAASQFSRRCQHPGPSTARR